MLQTLVSEAVSETKTDVQKYMGENIELRPLTRPTMCLSPLASLHRLIHLSFNPTDPLNVFLSFLQNILIF